MKLIQIFFSIMSHNRTIYFLNIFTECKLTLAININASVSLVKINQQRDRRQH